MQLLMPVSPISEKEGILLKLKEQNSHILSLTAEVNSFTVCVFTIVRLSL